MATYTEVRTNLLAQQQQARQAESEIAAAREALQSQAVMRRATGIAGLQARRQAGTQISGAEAQVKEAKQQISEQLQQVETSEQAQTESIRQAELYQSGLQAGYEMGVTGKSTYVGDAPQAYKDGIQAGLKAGSAEQARYGGDTRGLIRIEKEFKTPTQTYKETIGFINPKDLPKGERMIISPTGSLAGIQSEALGKSFTNIEAYNKAIESYGKNIKALTIGKENVLTPFITSYQDKISQMSIMPRQETLKEAVQRANIIGAIEYSAEKISQYKPLQQAATLPLFYTQALLEKKPREFVSKAPSYFLEAKPAIQYGIKTVAQTAPYFIPGVGEGLMFVGGAYTATNKSLPVGTRLAGVGEGLLGATFMYLRLPKTSKIAESKTIFYERPTNINKTPWEKTFPREIKYGIDDKSIRDIVTRRYPLAKSSNVDWMVGQIKAKIRTQPEIFLKDIRKTAIERVRKAEAIELNKISPAKRQIVTFELETKTKGIGQIQPSKLAKISRQESKVVQSAISKRLSGEIVPKKPVEVFNIKAEEQAVQQAKRLQSGADIVRITKGGRVKIVDTTKPLTDAERFRRLSLGSIKSKAKPIVLASKIDKRIDVRDIALKNIKSQESVQSAISKRLSGEIVPKKPVEFKVVKEPEYTPPREVSSKGQQLILEKPIVKPEVKAEEAIIDIKLTTPKSIERTKPLILKTKQLTIEPKARTISGFMSLANVQETNSINLKQLSKLRSIQLEELNLRNQTKQTQSLKSSISVNIASAPQININQPQRFNLDNLQGAKTRITTPNVSPPILKILEEERRKGKLKSIIDKLSGTKLYKVLSRRKGKWFDIAKGLPKGKAELAGVKYTKSTLARSFKLQEMGMGQAEDISFKVPSREYRLPYGRTKLPSGTYVQVKALSRGPEVREIKMFRSKKVKNIRW